ncbi:hypothetical protein VAWG004_23370 [Aeromonas veronii]|nr:hypothetical protein VAWG004_23370 [Aeromonas veronii]
MGEIDSQHELESLVAMAESVSATIEDINTKIANLRSMLMIVTVGAYAAVCCFFFLVKYSFRFENMTEWGSLFISAVTFALMICSIMFLFQFFRKMNDLKYKLKKEKEVLEHLLVLVFEYKDNIYSNKSNYVEKALIEIRLKRIGFSTRW